MKGRPELPCMARIKNESANIVKMMIVGDYFIKNYAGCLFYNETMLQQQR